MVGIPGMHNLRRDPKVTKGDSRSYVPLQYSKVGIGRIAIRSTFIEGTSWRCTAALQHNRRPYEGDQPLILYCYHASSLYSPDSGVLLV